LRRGNGCGFCRSSPVRRWCRCSWFWFGCRSGRQDAANLTLTNIRLLGDATSLHPRLVGSPFGGAIFSRLRPRGCGRSRRRRRGLGWFRSRCGGRRLCPTLALFNVSFLGRPTRLHAGLVGTPFRRVLFGRLGQKRPNSCR
jgi:hypothetical protein